MKRRICALFLTFCLLLTLCGDLRSLAVQAGYETDGHAETIDSVVGKQVKIAAGASMAWPLTDINNGTTIIAGVSEYAEVMVVMAVGTLNGVTYYQLRAADGYSWPQNSKVQDGYWLDSSKLEVIVTEEPCPGCGETDCDAVHFWCERCEEYDCGKDHLICRACGDVDCEKTHIFCGYCNDYDCGNSHDQEPVVVPVIPASPTLTSGADVSIVDEYGDAVEDNFVLFVGTKTSLSAWTDLEGDVSYQWQIWAEDQWVDIQGQIGQGILVSPAMLLSVAENNMATIRCEVTNGDVVKTSGEISVVVAVAPEAGSFVGSSSVAAAADEPELLKVNLVIEYKFGNNSIAANPWTAELTPGKPISEKIKLPVIPGYMPTVDPTVVSPEYAEIVVEKGVYYLQLKYASGVSEDTVLNVTYQPVPVTVTVQHYWQNVNNDNYVLHATTTKHLLTGSTVGDDTDGDGVPNDVHETYPGFYNLLYEKPVVAADGSTVVKVYYDRYYYLMKFDLSGGFGVDPLYIRYGAPVGFIPTPTRPGYDFDHWQLNGVDTEIPETMPAENQTYKAVWSNPKSVNYTVVYWRENADDTNYSIWGSVTRQAVAGTTVSGSDDIPTSVTNATIDGATVNERPYFTYNDALTNKNVVVNGDGSTTVHVYYTRNSYTIYFTGYGKCALTPHSHTDGKCNTSLICGETEHDHSAACGARELSCEIDVHTAHTDDCLICEESKHVHNIDCYASGYGEPITSTTQLTGTAKTAYNSLPSNPTNNRVYRYRQNNGSTSYYFFRFGGQWYYLGTSYDDNNVSVGGGNWNYSSYYVTYKTVSMNCSVEDHTHTDTCYKDALHTHTDICYTYANCNEVAHAHTDDCYSDCTLIEHTHNSNCTSNRTGNTLYVITAKYNQTIGDIWPTYDVLKEQGYAYKDSSGNVENNNNQKFRGWSMTGISSTLTSKRMNMSYDICSNTTNGVGTLTAQYDTDYIVHLYYMFESFDQSDDATVEAGRKRRKYNGNNGIWYDEEVIYTQTVYSNSNQFNQKEISGMIPAGVVRETVSSQNNEYDNFLYYKRNRNTIYFENTHTGDEEPSIKSVASVMYGQPLVNYSDNGVLLSATEAPYPSGLPEHAYRFDGWYTTPEGYEGTKFDFATATMPDAPLYLFAKWVPVTRTIRFFLDREDCEAGITIPKKLPRDPYVTDFETRLVPNGSYLLYVDDPGVADGDEDYHPYSQYRFEGWYYLDENGVEKRFVTGGDGLTVLQDLDLYAKWSSNVLKAYTVYFALDAKNNTTGADGADGIADTDANGNIIYVADPITGSTLAGTSRTFDAKGDTDLYVAYRNGYYPDTVSHTISVNIDDPDNEGANTHTFLYTPSDPVPYTVKYLIEGTNTPVPGTTQKYVEDNTKAVVTENFVAVSGYMPDEFQKTLVVRPGGENTLIFWYKEDILHALYQVNHYVQNLDGSTWTLYDSETITGDIGTAYSASPDNSIDGFDFSATVTDKYNITEKKNGYTGETLPGTVEAYADGQVTGTLTGSGMQLNLYYTRNVYPYQIYFLEYGSNEELKATVNGSALYGKLVSHTADSVIVVTDKGIEFELYDTEPELKTMTIMVDALTDGKVTYNKLIFYYTRCTQDLTVTKTVTGSGADPNQEFEFTVTIDPKYSFHQDSYAYGVGKYLTPQDGVLRFKLKAGQSITLQDLPTAEYTVTEVNLPVGYYADFDAHTAGEQTSAGIVLDRDVAATVNCTNIYDPAKLAITKSVDVVEDNANIPEVSEFEFFVTVPAGVTGKFDYTVGSETRSATVVDGKLTFKLQNGQTARFENVPVGTYTIEEEDYSGRGYKANFVLGEVAPLVERNAVDVTAERGDELEITCVNRFPVGHLQIQKTVTKEFFGTEWSGDTFTFTVERTTEGRPLINGNKYNVYQGENKIGTATVADGKLQVTIAFNEADAAKLDEKNEKDASVIRTIEIRNLPAGTYKVTEAADADYVQTPNGLIVSGLEIPAEKAPVAAFANKLIRPTGDLSLEKVLEAAEGFTGELPMHTLFTFSFEATLQAPPDGTYKVVYLPAVFTEENGTTVTAPTTVEMTDGKFTLQIQAGQKVTIQDLPIDTYRITEATVPRIANAFYHNGSDAPQTVTKDTDGNLFTEITVVKDAVSRVKCVNTYPVDHADLIIDHNYAEESQIFVYEVKNTTTNEIITVTVTGNGTTTIHDLPFGEYTVTQKNDWSWRHGEDDETQTVNHQAADTTVVFEKSWLDKWLGGCSNLLKNIFGGS